MVVAHVVIGIRTKVLMEEERNFLLSNFGVGCTILISSFKLSQFFGRLTRIHI